MNHGTKKFKTEINASPEKAWDVLWREESYSKWTAPFMEGSLAETDWQEGSKILFLDPDRNGIVSQIKTKKQRIYVLYASRHWKKWKGRYKV